MGPPTAEENKAARTAQGRLLGGVDTLLRPIAKVPTYALLALPLLLFAILFLPQSVGVSVSPWFTGGTALFFSLSMFGFVRVTTLRTALAQPEAGAGKPAGAQPATGAITVQRLAGSEPYTQVMTLMEKHHYFLNTVLNNSKEAQQTSGARDAYRQFKLDRLLGGKLVCREVYSPVHAKAYKSQKAQLARDVTGTQRQRLLANLDARDLDCGDLPWFQDFCLHLDHDDVASPGVVLFGWKSEPDVGLSCLRSEDPVLVARFYDYFSNLHRTPGA